MTNGKLSSQLEELEKRRGSETDPFKKKELDKQISLIRRKTLEYYDEKNVSEESNE